MRSLRMIEARTPFLPLKISLSTLIITALNSVGFSRSLCCIVQQSFESGSSVWCYTRIFLNLYFMWTFRCLSVPSFQCPAVEHTPHCVYLQKEDPSRNRSAQYLFLLEGKGGLNRCRELEIMSRRLAVQCLTF